MNGRDAAFRIEQGLCANVRERLSAVGVSSGKTVRQKVDHCVGERLVPWGEGWLLCGRCGRQYRFEDRNGVRWCVEMTPIHDDFLGQRDLDISDDGETWIVCQSGQIVGPADFRESEFRLPLDALYIRSAWEIDK